MQDSVASKAAVKGYVLALILVLCGAVPALPQAEVPQGLKASGAMLEDWRPPEYNGATLPGMRVEGAPTSGLLTALVPADLAGQEVCVRVIAARDYYIGTQSFTVAPAWGGGPSTVPLATRYVNPPQDLLRVGPEDALTRVSVGPCEAGTTNVILASGWKTLAGLSTLSVFVNAVDKDRVALEFHDDNFAVACAPKPRESGTYTHLCPVDATALGPGRHPFIVLAFRVVQRNGQPQEELRVLTEAELWLAAP